jgi:ABC-type transporter Mla MlaB component
VTLPDGHGGAYRVRVRPSGPLAAAAAVERADHVCWAYDDDAAFEDAAVRFLADGLARGDRLVWIGEGAADRLRRSGGPLAAVERLTGRRALRLMSLTEAYRGLGDLAADEQLATYEAATRRALADGFRGLRVVAEMTPVAREEGRRTGLLRWEHLADDYMASGAGFSGLCAYRRAALPPEFVADVAALHPTTFVEATTVPFRLWFEGGALAVDGDVDAGEADRLGRLLAGTHLRGPLIRLDLSRLEFVDLAGVRAVTCWAETLPARGVRLEITGAPRLFRRMWELLAPVEATVTFRGPRW